MFLWLLTFYQTGPNGLFIFYQVFNLILQSAKTCFILANENYLIIFLRDHFLACWLLIFAKKKSEQFLNALTFFFI